MVVLVILGICAGLSGLALGATRAKAVRSRDATLEDARQRAVMLQRSVIIKRNGRAIRFLPDGRVLGGDTIIADPRGIP
jgi:hypothetical protein